MQICERRHFTKANGDILFHLANKSKKTNNKKKNTRKQRNAKLPRLIVLTIWPISTQISF